MEVIVFFVLASCIPFFFYAYGADIRGGRTIGLPVKRGVLVTLLLFELTWYAVQLYSYEPPGDKGMHFYFVDQCLYTFPRGGIPVAYESDVLNWPQDGVLVKAMVLVNALVVDYVLLLVFYGIHWLVDRLRERM